MNNFKEISLEDSRKIDAGGRTYVCPFGCNYEGGYWATYWHCLRTKCFKRNGWCNFLYNAGHKCIDAGLQGYVMKLLNGSVKPPKHAAWR